MLSDSEPPNLITDPAEMEVLEELRRREPLFYQPRKDTTRADFENMMATDFWEIGASGRRYSREYALAVLEQRMTEGYGNDAMEVTDFHCRKLTDNVYLLTFTLFQGGRSTRRASIWHRGDAGWKIAFHQGTIILNG